MSDFYMVQLKPFDLDYRYRQDIVEPFQRASIKNRIFGMGWEAIVPDDGKARHWLDECYERTSDGKSRGERVALKIYNEIKENDYVITRLAFSTECYVGRVVSRAYREPERFDFDYFGNYSWIVDVEEWKPIGKFMLIPNALRGIMQGRCNTIKKIEQSSVQSFLIEKLYNGSDSKLELTCENFTGTLDSLDLEDLVAGYILSLKDNEGYTLIPSSCKDSEPLYEFRFVNADGFVLTCQVKNNKGLTVSSYSGDEFRTIYLFSGTGEYEGESAANVEIIDRDELFGYLRAQFLQKGYFYNLLREHYELSD